MDNKQTRLDRLRQRMCNKNVQIYNTSDVVVNRNRFSLGYKLIQTKWQKPAMYDKCHLCGNKVSMGFMKDHIATICGEQLIECQLCKQMIKRKDLLSHWKDGLCSEYTILCTRCGQTFENGIVYIQHQHHESYPDYEQETKYKWKFDTDDNNEIRQLYLTDDAVQNQYRYYVCSKCGGREEQKNENQHECDYRNDPNFNYAYWFTMRLRHPRYYIQDVINNMLRTESNLDLIDPIKSLIVSYYYHYA